ncbi:MAG TPA: FUSC family protein [Candidatus Didemnitutus sp.]|nr:FUSC family protein [Candidatus Didemnitutus sp.]
MSGVIARWRHAIEEKRLQPDLNRAFRATVAFMGPVLVAFWWRVPFEASFAALTAQSLAMVDIRGSYPLRLGLLLSMTCVMAASCWLGGMAADSLPWSLATIAVVVALSGVWRRLSTEYGPSLAVATAFLTLLSLARPGGLVEADRHLGAALVGGLWAVAVQVALWPFRAQHPLRRAVSDSWVALADVIAGILPDSASTVSWHETIAGRESALRVALDQATGAINNAQTRRNRPHLQELAELNLAAARLATRIVSFGTALESLAGEAGFDAIRSSLAPAVTSLGNSARGVALVLVSRQPSHLAATDVRLRRLATLLQALEDRVHSQLPSSAAAGQLTGILRQIAEVIPEVSRRLRSTVDRADERAAFSLELFDLQTWTLRPLASALNFRWQPDPALNRFIARSTVLQVFGVAIFKYYGLTRGYWLPLTVLVVMQPDYGTTRLRAGQRSLGTLIGSLAASALLALALPAWGLFLAMAGTMFAFAFWLKRNYAIAVGFITLFVVLITETSEQLTIRFTVERSVATLAGVVLALIATLVFWPVWERQVYPRYLSRALLANRDYFRWVLQRLREGGAYDAEVVAAKRAAEAANSLVFSSLQRMYADPRNQHGAIEAAAALANGNQRITRALTVIAIHLKPGIAVTAPAYVTLAELADQSFSALSETALGNATPALAGLRPRLDALTFPAASTHAPFSPAEHGAATQLDRCATELSAMILASAAPGSTGGNLTGLPTPASAS